MSKSNLRILLAVLIIMVLGSMGLMSVWSSAEAAPLGDDPTATPTPTPDYYLGNTYTGEVASYYDDVYWHWGNLCYTTRDHQVAFLGRTDKDTGEDSIASGDDLGPDACEGDPIGAGSNSRLGTQWTCYHGADEVDACTWACSQVGGCSEIKNSAGITEEHSEGTTLQVGIKHDPDFHAYNFYIVPVYYGVDDYCEQQDPTVLPLIGCVTLDGDDNEGSHEDLIAGLTYYLTTENGPWNDGSTDRYDIAYSWDEGSNWESLASAYEADNIDQACAADTSPEYAALKIIPDGDQEDLDLRVNDTEGDFGDNTGSIDYCLYGGAGGTSTGCGTRYTTGQLLETGSTDAGNEYGINMGPYFLDNNIIKIRIPHTYQTTQYDPIKYSAQADLKTEYEDIWTVAENHERVVCTEYHNDDVNTSEGWADYYFQAPFNEISYMIRPWAFFNQYSNNSGTFEYYLFASEYNPLPKSCSSKFRVDNYMEEINIGAYKSNGMKIPRLAAEEHPEFDLWPGNWYVLDTPTYWDGWDEGGYNFRYDFQISSDRETWQNMADFADCVEPIDQYHNRYFFQADQAYYYLRANDQDGNWDNNYGDITLILRGASDLRDDPDPETDLCPNYTTDTNVYNGSFSSQDATGIAIPDQTIPDRYYALQIDPTAWQSGGVDQYTAMIGVEQIGSPTEYAELSAWDGTLCTETTAAGFTRIYFKAQDVTYRLLADLDENDNLGTVHYSIYDAHIGQEPHNSSCEVDYNPLTFNEFTPYRSDIPGQWRNGVYIREQPLDPGTYMIQTSNYFSEMVIGGEPITSADLEISTDNGSSWTALTDFADCVVTLPSDPETLPDHHRVYFEITDEHGIVRLRADNQDAIWIDNTGAVEFIIKTNTAGQPIDPDPDEPDDPGDIYDPSVGCRGICTQPDSAINVPKWLVYVKCRVQSWLSWCNYHTAMIHGLTGIMEQREPFSAISDFRGALGMIRAEVESYGWLPAGGGSLEVDNPDNFIFSPPEGGGANLPIIGDNTPWGSGEINILGEGAEFSQTCNNRLATSLGDRLSGSLCFAFNALDSLGLRSWFQVMWDLTVLVAMGMYIQNKWIKPMQS